MPSQLVLQLEVPDRSRPFSQPGGAGECLDRDLTAEDRYGIGRQVHPDRPCRILLILPPAIQLHAVIMHALKKLPGFLSDTGPGFHEQLRRLLRPGAHRRLKAQHACCHRRKQLPVTSLWPVLFYFLHTR